MNIYQAIIKDHELQRELCDDLLNTKDKSAEERSKAYAELRKELRVHEVAEERHFYKPLIDTEKMIEDTRHGMAEHHEIDELIKKIDDTETDSDTWFSYAEKLCDKVEHHLKDEEEDFFKKARELYSEQEAEQLGNEYLNEMNEKRKEYDEEKES